jgi:dUTP pyrophosphatase
MSDTTEFLVRGATGVKIKKIHPDAIIPQYQTHGAVGFDLHVIEDYSIRTGDSALLRTGLVIKTPPGYMLGLFPRSSTWKKYGLVMPHSIGIIDQDYCGEEDEIFLQVYNNKLKHAIVEKGDRVAQGIFIPVARLSFRECDSMGESRGGFGSTGHA